ncbi:unnamed protein product [Rotaria sp. Silwood1]|nr:unnamed protein product [Rotaria sp. Silwood1]CAF0971964.1 unnamed protein product [Rotaria sp. Silwood1]CAF3393488.1 unnamed protein product [Rotaria sp. Silwood1]CAF3415433.1 unnamed protein product [Rotaria sp. Silwood1]CAF4696022.1 unnamed protein product [Rotaria sp. Silwood1]
MSSLLTNLSQNLHFHNDKEALDIAFNHFNHSDQPYNDLFEYLLILSESNQNNANLINCLIESFLQWKNQLNKNLQIPYLDENLMNDLILKKLPIKFLKDFCEIFQISKEHLIFLLRTSLYDPINSPSYKHALNIIVKFHYQLEFSPNEILLPLILDTKDHLIHVYIDKNRQLEEYVLDLLNYLYENGGKRLREILSNEFNIINPNFNKKALGKLAVRYWNAFGNEQIEKYPNLATLQHRRTLSYLINVKYCENNDEKTMSDEAWNELIEEMIQGNASLSEYFIELLVDKDDIVAVRYWMTQLNRPERTLSQWIQRYIRTKQNNRSSTVTRNQNLTQNATIEYHTIPLEDVQIIFIDSMSGYEHLLDRLFNANNAEEELLLGFDCEWKPIFNNTSTSKQRLSIIQIAFSNQIFLLDVLNFFHTCDSQTIQQRLANRLFDDDHVTILCYGFQADASMLTASYPIFEQALLSGKTLLDLSLVQTDLMNSRQDIFPYSKLENKAISKDKGLSELVRLCFGKTLNKSERCSNWDRRPLRHAQTLYAATDAYCLLDIYNFLRNRLQSVEYLQSFRGKKPKRTEQLIDKNDDFPTLNDITSVF